jgi:hypothetical protein
MLDRKQLLTLMIAATALAGRVDAATTTTYTDLTAWSAAAGSFVTEDFSDAALTPGLSIAFGTNIPGGSIASGAYHDISVTGFSNTNSLITFSTAVTAFGADWDLTPAGNGGGLLLQISYADATTGSLLIPYSATASFSGFVSDTNVASIRIHAADFLGEETFSADNFRFSGTPGGGNGNGGGPPIPEPGSALVFAAGVLVVRTATRRR